MNTVAAALLTLLLLVVWDNYRDGTLGQWAKAKFLNQEPG